MPEEPVDKREGSEPESPAGEVAEPATPLTEETGSGRSRQRIVILLVVLVVLGIASLWYNRHMQARQLTAARDLLGNAADQQLSPEDRWQAVQEAIVMLRDNLIQQQPEKVELYRELARVYLRQMANTQDQLRMFFLFRHAVEMIMAAGGPQQIDWAAVEQAPLEPNALAAQLGEEKMATLREIMAVDDSSFELFESQFRQNGGFSQELGSKLQEAGLLQPVDRYLRARWLRQGLKLEPAVILELEERLGKLDFRLPETHAIYWAERGLELAADGADDELEELVFRALQQSVMEGELVYMSPDGMPMLGPNVALVDAVDTRFQSRIAANPESHVTKASYRQFLEQVVIVLFMEAKLEEAQAYLDKLLEAEPPPEGQAAPELNAFVLERMGLGSVEMSTEQLDSVLDSLLMRFYLQVAVDRDPQANMMLWMAGCLKQFGSDEPMPEVGSVQLGDLATKERRLQLLAAATLNLPSPLAGNLVQKLGVGIETLEPYRQQLIEQAEAARQQQGQLPMPAPSPGQPDIITPPEASP